MVGWSSKVGGATATRSEGAVAGWPKVRRAKESIR